MANQLRRQLAQQGVVQRNAVLTTLALGTRLHFDVELYWQRWRLDSPVLGRLTDVVRRAARAGLR